MCGLCQVLQPGNLPHYGACPQRACRPQNYLPHPRRRRGGGPDAESGAAAEWKRSNTRADRNEARSAWTTVYGTFYARVMGREPEDEPSPQDQFVQRDQRAQDEPGRRWLVLLSSSYFSFTNAVMIMDFATDYTLSEALLGGASQADVALLYSLFLLCVMPTMFFAAYGVVHHNYVTMAIGQSLNVVGAWLRYAAVLNGSFPLAVVSTVCAGASHRWTLERHI